MGRTVAAAYRSEVCIVREEQVQVYGWGEARPQWSQRVKGSVTAVACTPQVVYVATTSSLIRLPRRPFEPAQRYALPTRTGAPTRLWAYNAQVGLLTERGGLWHARYPEMRWQLLELSKAALTSVALWESQAVLADSEGQVYHLELGTIRVLARWSGGLGGVYDWAWHPRGKWIAGACADGLVKLWTPATGKPLQAFAAHRLPPRLIAAHPNGNQLVSLGMDGLLFFYDLVQGRAQLDAPLHAPDDATDALALHWESEKRLWLLTASGFHACTLPEGRWRTQPIPYKRPNQ